MNDTTTPPPLAWHQHNRLKSERRALHRYAGLCAIEPLLASLLVDVLRQQPHSAAFKEHFLPRIAGLVGAHARKSLPALRTVWAYETAYAVLHSYAYDPPKIPRFEDEPPKEPTI